MMWALTNPRCRSGATVLALCLFIFGTPKVNAQGSLPTALSWATTDSTAVEYLFEWSTDPAFATGTADSGWITATQYAVSGRVHGQRYYYRVKARNAAALESLWSDTASAVHDTLPPETTVGSLPTFQTTAVFPISWSGLDPVSGVRAVRLFYTRDAGAPLQYPGEFTASPILFDSALTGGDGEYTFYTIGVDNAGNVQSPPGVPGARTTVLAAPVDPPLVAAEPPFTSGTANTIAWTAAASARAGYLEWSTSTLFAAIAGNSGWTTAPLHTATNLRHGRTYSYRVKARNAASVESAWSNVVSSTQDTTGPRTAALALPARVSTAVFNVPTTGTDEVSGLIALKLFYRRGPTGPYTLYQERVTTRPVTFAFDSAQTGGDGAYSFHTVGTDNAGIVEDPPAVADAATTVAATLPPAPVLAAKPAFTRGTTNDSSWTSVPQSTAYYLEWSTSSLFASVAGRSDWIAATAFQATGLGDGRLYYYRVKCRDARLVESDWSNVAGSTQDYTPPATAAGSLPPNAATTRTLQLSWSGADSVSGLAGVRLYYRRGATGLFQPYGGEFATSPIVFDLGLTGGDGFYEFYTIGSDNVGNSEDPPAAPDAQVLVSGVGPARPFWRVSPPEFTSETLTLP